MPSPSPNTGTQPNNSIMQAAQQATGQSQWPAPATRAAVQASPRVKRPSQRQQATAHSSANRPIHCPGSRSFFMHRPRTSDAHTNRRGAGHAAAHSPQLMTSRVLFLPSVCNTAKKNAETRMRGHAASSPCDEHTAKARCKTCVQALARHHALIFSFSPLSVSVAAPEFLLPRHGPHRPQTTQMCSLVPPSLTALLCVCTALLA